MHPEPHLPAMISRPGEPTNAAPGSERKICILTERASRREPLFHALDGCTKHARFALPMLGELARRPESA